MKKKIVSLLLIIFSFVLLFFLCIYICNLFKVDWYHNYKTAIEHLFKKYPSTISFISKTPIVDNSFLHQKSTIPILSIHVNDKDLWSFSAGIIRNAYRRGVKWERKAILEYIDIYGKTILKSHIKIRLHGNGLRTFPKKSFRIYFNQTNNNPEIYSTVKISNVEHDFINETAIRNGSLVLKSPYGRLFPHDLDLSDENYFLYGDQISRELFNNMGVFSLKGRFIRLFINNHPWGIYTAIERIDEKLLSYYLGKTNWDIITYGDEVILNEDNPEAKSGNIKSWIDFISWVKKNDLSKEENYLKFKQLINIEQLTAFYILNLWNFNCDWLKRNFYAYKKSNSIQWNILLWDCECSFGAGYKNLNKLGLFTMIFGKHKPLSLVFAKLIQNQDYKKYFFSSIQHYLNTSLQSSRMLAIFNKLDSEITPYLEEEEKIWNPIFTKKKLESANIFANKLMMDRNRAYWQSIFNMFFVAQKDYGYKF